MTTVHRSQKTEIQLEVRDLLHRYAWIVDQHEFLAWLDLFTDEAAYSAITHENVEDQGLYLFRDAGRMALKQRVAWLMEMWQVPRSRTIHAVTNIEVSPTSADRAEVRSYGVIFRTGENGISQLHAAVTYEDIVVKTGDEWRFEERKVIVSASTLPPAFTELL